MIKKWKLDKRIHSLTVKRCLLYDFSYNHSFQAVPGVPGGDLRAAYLYKEENYEVHSFKRMFAGAMQRYF
jgi:hypothetical protein